MIKQKLKEYKQKLDDLILIGENSFNDNFDRELFESKVEKLEEDVLDNQDEAFDEGFEKKIKELRQGINELKEEHEFFDPESELDNMFPNRSDEDFDEDDMSYDSVFGDD